MIVYAALTNDEEQSNSPEATFIEMPGYFEGGSLLQIEQIDHLLYPVNLVFVVVAYIVAAFKTEEGSYKVVVNDDKKYGILLEDKSMSVQTVPDTSNAAFAEASNQFETPSVE